MKYETIELPPLFLPGASGGYTKEEMQLYAREGIVTYQQGGNAKQRYDEIMKDETEELDPIEDLRFFCSLAMRQQDWLDVESFFDALIADRKSRSEPVAYQVRCGVGEDWYEADQQAYQLVRSTRPCDARALYLAPQPAEPVKLDRYDAGYLGGQDGMPAYVWHDIIRSELDRAYDFYMDQIDRAAPQPAEPVMLECPKCGVDRAKAPCAGNLMDCEFKGVAHAAEPVKHKRQYAQGTALGEFGIIPMCDQVNDDPQPGEPVKCQDPSMGEHACSDRDQCWEPCGELGISVEHARVADPVNPNEEYKPEYKHCEDGKVVWMNAADAPVVKSAETVKVPNDEAIQALAKQYDCHQQGFMGFARALLARYGNQENSNG